MEIRDLLYFLACLEEGHLTQAAQRLHVAQPTLSHALVRLETEAGETLLTRSRRGTQRIRATPAGQLLEARARRAVAELSGFSDDLSALRGVMRGELRIGSMQSLNSTQVPRPLARFALQHPGVEVSLFTLAAEDIPKAIFAGRVDVGLLAGAPASALRGLCVQPLQSEQLVAIVRRDDPLAQHRSIRLHKLANRGMVLVLAHTFTRNLILNACQMAGFSPRILLSLESGEAIREVVRGGLGITILPAGYLHRRDPTLRAVRITQPSLTREVMAVWDERTTTSAALGAFLTELRRGGQAPAVGAGAR